MFAVAKTIGQHLTAPGIVINKSTVPVGTANKVKEIIQSELERRGAKISFHTVSNPEFLKQGAAIADFMHSDRIIVGADNPVALKKMRALYALVSDDGKRFIGIDLPSAELIKYAANAFFAMTISFSWVFRRNISSSILQ